jgi:hypothetical protein
MKRTVQKYNESHTLDDDDDDDVIICFYICMKIIKFCYLLEHILTVYNRHALKIRKYRKIQKMNSDNDNNEEGKKDRENLTMT